MAQITQDMLRKKAEHNEGLLTTLEEISLHQLNIEKIANLDVFCRHLKILYLQNNLIGKMEGIHKLKELEYINLAVNNVTLIEGIRGCESLQKIDLTLNFVDVEDFEESVDNLTELPDIRELYFVGNPCTNWQYWRQYLMARLPTLGRIDGEECTKGKKLEAKQNLEMMEKDLTIVARKSIEKKVLEEKEGTFDPNAYTPAFRRECYEEEVERKAESDKKGKENSMFKDYNEMMAELDKNKGKPLPIYNDLGLVRQANQGKYEWRYDQTPDKTQVIFEIKVPKFLPTHKVNVDLQPTYLRIDINGYITQLTHPEEVLTEKSKVERSKTTGHLQLTMAKANITTIEAQNMRIKKKMEERTAARKLRDLEKQQEIAKEQADELRKADYKQVEQEVWQEEMKEGEKIAKSKKMAKPEDYDNTNFIIREAELNEEKKRRDDEKKRKFYEEFKPDFDMDEVPPLE